MNKFEKVYYDIILETNETSNIAKEPGKYENFTGTIDFGWNKGTVKNATFELSTYSAAGFDRLEIIWEDGIWEDGNWDKGTWYAGTWKNGKWQYGKFLGGVFENGQVWEGHFKNMTWKNGRCTTGSFNNCIFENGHIFRADFTGGIFKDGEFVHGRFKDGKFEGGIFKGIFEGGTFDGGTFDGGTWNLEPSIYHSQPVWKAGTWKSGYIEFKTYTTFKSKQKADKVKNINKEIIKSDVNPNEALKEYNNIFGIHNKK
jgi:hypothetical protein